MSIEPVKVLCVGESGSGKTGALASLAASGYRLRIMDLDNNSHILGNLLSSPESPYVKRDAKVAERLESVIPLSEKRKGASGKLAISKAEVWGKASALLEDWKDGEKSFGSILTWTVNDVLVIDTLTRLGSAAMRFVQAINGRLNQHPYQSDYGDAQDLLRNFIEIVTDADVRCNVIINCHVSSIEDSNAIPKDFPKAPGKALSKEVATYFGNLLEFKTSGVGANVKRVIRTVPSGTLGVKTSSPFAVKPEYSLETGLAEYFAAVRGS